MAEKKITQSVEDLVTVSKTFFLDLPLTRVKQGLGIGGEKETLEVAWKGYDAGVRLATAAIDNLYRTPLFGTVIARSLDGALRWKRLSDALAGVFFTGLWQAVGLPTAADTQALRSEVHALREEFRSLSVGLPVRSKKKKMLTELDERLEALQAQMPGTEKGIATRTAA